MQNNLIFSKSKITFFSLFVCIFTIFCSYFVFNIKKFLRRGIDLVGGTYIVLDVDITPLCREMLVDLHKKIEENFNGKGIIFDKAKFSSGQLSFTTSDVHFFKAYIDDNKRIFSDFVISIKEKEILITLSENSKKYLFKNAIASNIKALRNRLDPFGAGEILIVEQGDKIIIELPNVRDVSQAKALIGKTALLMIRPVIDVGREKEKLEIEYADFMDEFVIVESDEGEGWYVLPQQAEVTGAFLKDARFGYDPRGGNMPIVHFAFNDVGGKKFSALTKKNIGKQLAISIDDKVISAPRVNEAIGAEGVISGGNFTPQSAQELAMLLKSGSFAAPVKYSQERCIEPLLGEKTVNKGLFACLFGLFLLFLASVFVYKVAGVVAFVMLIYNLLFSLLGLWMIGGVLTLSGIAGLLLTVGMAIDSSILIFERVKEELCNGKDFKSAIEAGFSGSMSIIIDANITHFLVALVLYYVGAGPLKGFALTMMVGIVSTILTGIVMMKSFFRYIFRNLGLDVISL